MKRKFISLFLIVILIIIMTACEGKSVSNNFSQTGGSVKHHNNTASASTGVTSKTDNSIKANNAVKANQSVPKESYYGDWVIKKEVFYGPVGTYSNDAIKKMLGKKLSYSSESAVYETNTCEKPFYQKTIVSQADFQINNKVKLSDLGITNNSVAQVIVYTDSSYKNIWNQIGCEFYIKDPNTLIMLDGGVYFELDRASN